MKPQKNLIIGIENKFIKTSTTVFQSGISLESVPHAHLTIEYPSPLCC